MSKEKGKIQKYNEDRGFGFINYGKDEIFFHISDCDFDKIKPGESVEFKIGQGDKGPKAFNVKIIEDKFTEFLKDNVLNLEDADYDKFCDTVKEYAVNLKDGGLTTSKIRKIYSRIMNTDSPRELKMLRPQFAYTAGRNDESGVQIFMDLLDYLASKMKNNEENELKNFKTFMESVVAYRKYAGEDN